MILHYLQKLYDSTPRQKVEYIWSKLSKQKEKETLFISKLPCIFVLSTGRVGTQTISALINLCPNFIAYHEPSPKLYGLSKLAYNKYIKNQNLDLFKEAFLTARRKLLNYSLKAGKGYAETSPQTTFLAPVILESLPNVRFIHLVRDPRNVVRSGMNRCWYDGHPADKIRIIPLQDTEAGRQWESYNSFQKNLWLWTETNKWILAFSSRLPSEKIILIHSENIFGAHPETLKKVFNFSGSPVPPQRKLLRVLRKKLNAQKTGSFPEPKNWPEIMQRDLVKITGETAKTLGYNIE
jgi:hypothetical protein